MNLLRKTNISVEKVSFKREDDHVLDRGRQNQGSNREW